MTTPSFEEAFVGMREMLVRKMDIRSGLLTLLKDHGVLEKDQIDEIDQKMKVHRESVEALLAALERRPPKDFMVFCNCLVKTNQQHIVDVLLSKTQEP
jgi:hypothetical protein